MKDAFIKTLTAILVVGLIISLCCLLQNHRTTHIPMPISTIPAPTECPTPPIE